MLSPDSRAMSMKVRMMQPIMSKVIEEDSIDPNALESYFVKNHLTNQSMLSVTSTSDAEAVD